MDILHLPNDSTRETRILTALGDLYGLTIHQMNDLWGWKSYPKTSEAFKRITFEREGVIFEANKKTPPKEFLIYRVRRGTIPKETIKGDVYVLLTNGAKVLREDGYNPTFSFELNKAQTLRPGGMEHTLLVNEFLIKLILFSNTHQGRLRIEDITHERSMRGKYKDAFRVLPDGFVKFWFKSENRFKPRCFFVEIEHTSAHDKEKWTAKVRQYINIFEYHLQTYFQSEFAFVVVIVTSPEYVWHLRNWTETTLKELDRDEYRDWFRFGNREALEPTPYFCSPRFLRPFDDAPHELFDGLLINSASS
jgi:hypothetical protein